MCLVAAQRSSFLFAFAGVIQTVHAVSVPQAYAT
jgi:hypothetical protein